MVTLSGANFGVDATLITVLWNGAAVHDVKVRQLPPKPVHTSVHSQERCVCVFIGLPMPSLPLTFALVSP